MMISGAVELEEALQPVVAVDDATVEVVQIAGGETAAVEGNEGAEIRRKHRNHRQHHPLRAVAALAERLANLKALDALLTLGLAGGRAHLLTELFRHLVDVAGLQHLEDGFAAHAGGELVVTVFFEELRVAILGEELTLREGRLLRVDDHVRFAVEDLLEILQRDVEDRADAAREAL